MLDKTKGLLHGYWPKHRLIKQTKACLKHVALAEANVSKWQHKAGQLLIELKEQCDHGEWLPALKKIGINERRAQELMQIGRDPAKLEQQQERARQGMKASRAKAKANTRNVTRISPKAETATAAPAEIDMKALHQAREHEPTKSERRLPAREGHTVAIDPDGKEFYQKVSVTSSNVTEIPSGETPGQKSERILALGKSWLDEYAPDMLPNDRLALFNYLKLRHMIGIKRPAA
jgi:hypothetical protein